MSTQAANATGTYRTDLLAYVDELLQDTSNLPESQLPAHPHAQLIASRAHKPAQRPTTSPGPGAYNPSTDCMVMGRGGRAAGKIAQRLATAAARQAGGPKPRVAVPAWSAAAAVMYSLATGLSTVVHLDRDAFAGAVALSAAALAHHVAWLCKPALGAPASADLQAAGAALAGCLLLQRHTAVHTSTRVLQWLCASSVAWSSAAGGTVALQLPDVQASSQPTHAQQTAQSVLQGRASDIAARAGLVHSAGFRGSQVPSAVEAVVQDHMHAAHRSPGHAPVHMPLRDIQDDLAALLRAVWLGALPPGMDAALSRRAGWLQWPGLLREALHPRPARVIQVCAPAAARSLDQRDRQALRRQVQKDQARALARERAKRAGTSDQRIFSAFGSTVRGSLPQAGTSPDDDTGSSRLACSAQLAALLTVAQPEQRWQATCLPGASILIPALVSVQRALHGAISDGGSSSEVLCSTVAQLSIATKQALRAELAQLMWTVWAGELSPAEPEVPAPRQAPAASSAWGEWFLSGTPGLQRGGPRYPAPMQAGKISHKARAPAASSGQAVADSVWQRLQRNVPELAQQSSTLSHAAALAAVADDVWLAACERAGGAPEPPVPPVAAAPSPPAASTSRCSASASPVASFSPESSAIEAAPAVPAGDLVWQPDTRLQGMQRLVRATAAAIAQACNDEAAAIAADEAEQRRAPSPDSLPRPRPLSPPRPAAGWTNIPWRKPAAGTASSPTSGVDALTAALRFVSVVFDDAGPAALARPAPAGFTREAAQAPSIATPAGAYGHVRAAPAHSFGTQPARAEPAASATLDVEFRGHLTPPRRIRGEPWRPPAADALPDAELCMLDEHGNLVPVPAAAAAVLAEPTAQLERAPAPGRLQPDARAPDFAHETGRDGWAPWALA